MDYQHFKQIDHEKCIIKSTLLLFSLLIVSCVNNEYDIADNEIRQENSENQFEVTYADALIQLDQVLDDVDIKTRGAHEKRKVANYYKVGEMNTRSDADSKPTYYVFNFENDGGFAIVSGDKRTVPVFALADDGNLNVDSIENPGVKIFLENIGIDWDDFIDKPVAELGEWTITKRIGAVSPVKWGQKYPFNKYCPRDYPAGCGPIAMAQVCYIFESPSAIVLMPGSLMNLYWSEFKKIKTRYDFGDNILAGELLSQYISKIGSMAGANYGSKGTWIFYKKIPQTMRNLGYSTSWHRDYNQGEVIATLERGGAVIAMGYAVTFLDVLPTDAHFWVIDAAVERRTLNYFPSDPRFRMHYLVHCNWGWDGSGNGYYYSMGFNTKNYQGRILYDNEKPTRSGSEGNYTKRVEYVAIEKPN